MSSKFFIESLEPRTLLAEVALVQNINRDSFIPSETWLATLNGNLLIDTSSNPTGSLRLITPAGVKTDLLKEGTREIGTAAATVGGITLFTLGHYTADFTHVFELWKTNGTVAGTVKIKDIGSSN